MGLYDFKVKTISGQEKSLSDYKGKVLLIVNVASKCGFTAQYEELQALYMKYKERGFEILGFPCNQFAAQEPGTNAEVQQFCKLNFGVTFPLFEKNDVRGENAQPLYKFLVAQKGFRGFDMDHPNAQHLLDVMKEKFPEYLEGDDIHWNFTKFLVDRDGKVVARFEPTRTPSSITGDVETLL